MIVVIQVQYKENYGSEAEPYWKFKGGSFYKIVGVPEDTEITEVVARVAPEIEYSETFSEQYILDYFRAEDDWQSDFERSQEEYDGEIRFPEPVIQWQVLVDNQARVAV